MSQMAWVRVFGRRVSLPAMSHVSAVTLMFRLKGSRKAGLPTVSCIGCVGSLSAPFVDFGSGLGSPSVSLGRVSEGGSTYQGPVCFFDCLNIYIYIYIYMGMQSLALAALAVSALLSLTLVLHHD